MFIPQDLEQVQMLTPPELKQWMQQADKPLLIDVRSPEMHKKDSLGGENIPLEIFGSTINQLDPDQAIVIYCQKGVKSFNAANLLIKADFSCVYSLTGGVESWLRTQ